MAIITVRRLGCPWRQETVATSMQSPILAAAVLCMCFLYAAPALLADETAASTRIDDLQTPTDPDIAAIDQQILLECIKLARFNLQFHATVNHKNFYQQWIYPLERETATVLGFSSSMVDVSQRARGLQNLKLISVPSLKGGAECALVGQAITGTSSGFQLAENLIQSAHAKRHGYSPSGSMATVQRSVAVIDKLLASRAQRLSDRGIDDRQRIYALQSRLMEHIKNQLVFEFKTWSTQSRSVEWAENTFYAIDSLQGFTQMSASIQALNAFGHHKLGGGPAITGLVSSTMVMVNPMLRSLVGRFEAKMQRRRLDRLFPGDRPKPIDEVLAEFGTTKIAGTKGSIFDKQTDELAFLIRRSEALDAPLDREVARFQKLRRIADQQAVSGPLIGLAGVTRGILNTTAFYGFLQSPATNPDVARRDRITANKINFAGRIVQSSAQAYSMVLTPATEIRHFLYARKLERSGSSPEQMRQARFARLDELEARIKSAR